MKKSLFFGLLLIFAACGGPYKQMMRAFDKANEDFLIQMERTACFGTCPVYTVKIEGDGQLLYTGKEFAQPKGEHKVQISEEDLRRLQEKIAGTEFLLLEDEYDSYITDVPSTITEVRIGDKISKKVINRWEAPERLVRLETYIDELWQKYLEAKE